MSEPLSTLAFLFAAGAPKDISAREALFGMPSPFFVISMGPWRYDEATGTHKRGSRDTNGERFTAECDLDRLDLPDGVSARFEFGYLLAESEDDTLDAHIVALGKFNNHLNTQCPYCREVRRKEIHEELWGHDPA
jgi:hypothetical protein